MNDLDEYVKKYVSPLEDDLTELEEENKELRHDKETLMAWAIGNNDLRLTVIDMVVKNISDNKSIRDEVLAAMMEQLNIATDLGQKRFEENVELRRELAMLKERPQGM